MAEHGLQREASNLPLTTSHHVDPGMESGMGSGSIVVSPSFCCLRYRRRSPCLPLILHFHLLTDFYDDGRPRPKRSANPLTWQTHGTQVPVPNMRCTHDHKRRRILA